MKKLGKISPIKKEVRSSILTMQSELAKHGYNRLPGTWVMKFPYKEVSGKYRTGLDPDAAYIQRIEDKTERELEIQRVSELRKELERELGLDLSPTSKFWNYSLKNDTDPSVFVEPAKLYDKDNVFDLSIPWQALTFAWLRVHPTIASSYSAWERGEYPPDTQFYVADEELENKILYSKKKLINDAIITFEKMDPDKRKKVARLMGLPVTDDTQETIVYNLVDSAFKQTEYKVGQYKGLTPVEVFTRFAKMSDALINVKDTVKQALTHSVYRYTSGGKIYKGEFKVADSEEEAVKYLMDEDHQDDLIQLQEDIKAKKLLEV